MASASLRDWHELVKCSKRDFGVIDDDLWVSMYGSQLISSLSDAVLNYEVAFNKIYQVSSILAKILGACVDLQRSMDSFKSETQWSRDGRLRLKGNNGRWRASELLAGKVDSFLDDASAQIRAISSIGKSKEQIVEETRSKAMSTLDGLTESLSAACPEKASELADIKKRVTEEIKSSLNKKSDPGDSVARKGNVKADVTVN